MPFSAKKHPALRIIRDQILPSRRSSLKVNLSYASSLSDSGNESFGSTRNGDETSVGRKTEISCKIDETSNNVKKVNLTVVHEDPEVSVVSEKDIALDKSCQQLKDVIMQKTKELFDNREELTVKTASVLKGHRQALREINQDSETIGIRRKGSALPCTVTKTSPRKRTSNDDLSKTQCSPRKMKGNHSLILGGNRYQEHLLQAKDKVLEVKLTRIEESRSNYRESSIDSNISDIGVPVMCSSFIVDPKSNLPLSQQAESKGTTTIGQKSRKSTCPSEDVSSLTPKEITAIRKENPSASKSRNFQNKSKNFEGNRSNDNRSCNEAVPMELTSVQSHLPLSEISHANETPHTSLSVNESIKSNSSSDIQNENTAISLTVNTSLENQDSENLDQDKSSKKNESRKTPDSEKVEKRTIISNSDSDSMEEMSLLTRLRNNPRKKCPERKSVSSNQEGISFIEGTPYPPSRSFMWKTQIKLDRTKAKEAKLQKNLQISADQLFSNNSKSDTSSKNSEYLSAGNSSLIVNESPQKNDSRGESVRLIEDSSREKGSSRVMESVRLIKDSSREKESSRAMEKSVEVQNDKEQDPGRKKVGKKKLLSKRDEPEMITFTPLSLEDSFPKKSITWKPRKYFRKKTIRAAREKKIEASIREDSSDNDDPVCSNTRIIKKAIVQPPVKKTRKVISKKIVIKKNANRDWLERLRHENSGQSSRSNERSSMNEFLSKKRLSVSQRNSKPQKLVIVATGFSKGDMDMIKSIVKELGNAELASTVTRRTTHVVSTGVRTVNLLRGIIRGCWLLSLDWVLKSLENGKWLNPEKYEMAHFSKAVQENRRDREMFGKSYVPELFTTCGLIHVQNGTSPPPDILKELVKTAGGRITEDPKNAVLSVGPNGLKEIWILDSITTGDVQPLHEYQHN